MEKTFYGVKGTISLPEPVTCLPTNFQIYQLTGILEAFCKVWVVYSDEMDMVILVETYEKLKDILRTTYKIDISKPSSEEVERFKEESAEMAAATTKAVYDRILYWRLGKHLLDIGSAHQKIVEEWDAEE